MVDESERLAAEKEVKMNSDAYEKIKTDLEQKYNCQYALMHDGELFDIYQDSDTAYSTGCKNFGLGKFSVQEIGAKPISLGIFTFCIDGSKKRSGSTHPPA